MIMAQMVKNMRMLQRNVQVLKDLTSLQHLMTWVLQQDEQHKCLVFSSDDSEDYCYDPSGADIFKKVQKEGLSSDESDFTSTLMSLVF